MVAKEIMTRRVVRVTRGTAVCEIVSLLLKHRISAVPVVDAEDRFLGVVSEAELTHRVEIGTEGYRSWWTRLLAGPENLALEYVKSHGPWAADVLSRDTPAVGPDTPLAEIVRLFDRRRIHWVPVVEAGKLLGVVSRTDLLRRLSAQKAPGGTSGPPDDEAIRRQLLEILRSEGWAPPSGLHVFVRDGVVDLWGHVDSEGQGKAIRTAASTIPGVRAVEDHLVTLPAWAWAE
jgi:CBS domain-containing protein